MDAAALIVGIDDYRDLPLDGSVKDALEATDWLTSIGVSPARIRLHIAPKAGDKPATQAGVTVKGATRDEIWASIVDLRGEKGDRLYVFLSGHGYYLAATGPIYLCQDWSPAFSHKNLDIRSFVELFLSFDFRDQLMVVDACQNAAVDPIYRDPFVGAGHGVGALPVKPANGLVLCCAAAALQYAPIVDNRGLLTRHLLANLRLAPDNLPPTASDALFYDWATGVARLDLRPLFDNAIAGEVSDAALKHGGQTPTLQAHGRATAERRWFVQEMPNWPTTKLTVDARSLDGLYRIALGLQPPASELILTAKSTFPYTCLVPVGRHLIGRCEPIPNWRANPTSTNPIQIVDPAPPLDFDISPAGQDRDVEPFNLNMVDPSGAEAWELNGDDYKAVGVATGVDKAPPPGELWIETHERGPDIHLNGVAFEEGARVARDLRDRLTKRLAERRPGFELALTLPGQAWALQRPNLRLELPPGGVEGLVGFLGPEPLIRIDRIGADPEAFPPKLLSADRLALRSWIRLDPGDYRIRVETPWGVALATVALGEVPVTMTVPQPVGREPLRNLAPRGEEPWPEGELFRIHPPADDGRGFRTLGRPRAPRLHLILWESDGDPLGLATVVSNPPWVTLLASTADQQRRVEPFSRLPWAEWDLAVGAGRLDAVDLDQAARRLSEGSPEANTGELDLFRLAMGYAAWGQGKTSLIREFLEGLSPAAREVPDATLLRLEADEWATTEALNPPMFRWGVLLAPRRAPRTVLPGEPSPFSSWAVYETQSLGEPLDGAYEAHSPRPRRSFRKG